MTKIDYDGLHISVIDNMIKVKMPQNPSMHQLIVLQLFWPLPVKYMPASLPCYFRPGAESYTYLTGSGTHYVTKSGVLSCEELWDWNRGRKSVKDVLRSFVMDGGGDETYSFQETGGSCYSLFEVGSDWREIGFVDDPAVTWLCLETDNYGFHHVHEWSDEDYEENIVQFEQWYEDDDDV